MFYIIYFSMLMLENPNFPVDDLIRLIDIESNLIEYFDHRLITITHVLRYFSNLGSVKKSEITIMRILATIRRL